MFGNVNNPMLAGGPVGPRPALAPQPGGNPVAAYAQMLQQGGMLPPPRQQFQPTPEQLEQMRRDRLFAMGNNLARTWGANTEYVDPYAAQDQLRAQRQGQMDEQWVAQAERAKALREVTSDDLIAFMLDQAGGKFKGSFAEWQQASGRAADTTPADVRSFMFGEQLRAADPEAYQRFVDSRWAPKNQSFTVGGVRYDASGNPIIDPETVAATIAAQAEAGAGGKAFGASDAAFDVAAGEAYDSLGTVRTMTQKMIDLINSNPDMQTGPLVGQLAPYYSDIVARLETLSTIATVPALSAAKLQPVTNQELETIRKTFASALRDPRANLGALQAQLEAVDAKLQEWNHKMDYFQSKGTMRGYGIEAARRAKASAGGAGDDDVIDLPARR